MGPYPFLFYALFYSFSFLSFLFSFFFENNLQNEILFTTKIQQE